MPLLDCGLSKEQIRAASRGWGLPTWDKPAADCLSSRIAYGIEVTPDKSFFDGRRRSKNEAELAGIRRAQRAAEAGIAAGLELLRRAEARNGGLAVDGEPLTCELVKQHVERTFGDHGATAFVWSVFSLAHRTKAA